MIPLERTVIWDKVDGTMAVVNAPDLGFVEGVLPGAGTIDFFGGSSP